MSACSNFTPSPWKSTQCADCCYKISDHPNTSTGTTANIPSTEGSSSSTTRSNAAVQADRPNLPLSSTTNEILRPRPPIPPARRDYRNTMPPTTVDGTTRPRPLIPVQRTGSSDRTPLQSAVSVPTSRIPEASSPTRQRPEASSATTRIPEVSNPTRQRPEASSATTRIPEASSASSRQPRPLNSSAPQAASSECQGQVTRRVLFIGPAGAGKSTIINVLFNNQVNAEAMSRPAATGGTTSGQTGFFTTYYDFPNYAYTDSIGLGDPRFRPEAVMDSLKSVLEMASVGYNKIYICLQYGRIPTDTRKYIELITTVFGKKVLEWSSIIFTRCNDQTMTKEKFLIKNSGDADIVEIVNQVNSVIFGDNMTDTDSEIKKSFMSTTERFSR